MKKSIYTLKAILPKIAKDCKKWHYETDDENNFKCHIIDVGVFSSIKESENTIKKLIEVKNKENERWGNWEVYVGFLLEEHYIDDALDENGNIAHFESYRSYLSDGTLNCASECDYRCTKKFNGTKYPNKHTKKGDIAFVLCGEELLPVLVECTSMTKNEWRTKIKGYGDFTDDSGLAFSAFNDHVHPFAPELFPLSCLPKAKISKDIIKRMKTMRKGYFNGTTL